MARRSGGRATGPKTLPRLLVAVFALLIALVVAGCGFVPQQAPSSQPAQSGQQGQDQRDDAADDSQASGDPQATDADDAGDVADDLTVEEDGWYTDRDSVALYIHTYGHLPGNFISKTKARNAGWDPSAGNLDEVCPGMSIGGSRFYNDDGLLPDAPGRTWTECDINYHGGYRGAERIVFSSDGLIFYTDDHYETFVQLY